MGEKTELHSVFVGKPEGKRPLRKSRRRWKDNIKMNLLKVVRWGLDGNDLAQGRESWRALVNAVMNIRDP
jgi:hypothetical protein